MTAPCTTCVRQCTSRDTSSSSSCPDHDPGAEVERLRSAPTPVAQPDGEPASRQPLHRECAMFPPEERCGECGPLSPAVPAPVVQGDPMFWVRLCSDGGYEGLIHNDAIERVRRLSGAWHPLFLGAAPAPVTQGWKVTMIQMRCRDGAWREVKPTKTNPPPVGHRHQPKE